MHLLTVLLELTLGDANLNLNFRSSGLRFASALLTHSCVIFVMVSQVFLSIDSGPSTPQSSSAFRQLTCSCIVGTQFENLVSVLPLKWCDLGTFFCLFGISHLYSIRVS